jgi:hypothetical protein
MTCTFWIILVSRFERFPVILPRRPGRRRDTISNASSYGIANHAQIALYAMISREWSMFVKKQKKRQKPKESLNRDLSDFIIGWNV